MQYFHLVVLVMILFYGDGTLIIAQPNPQPGGSGRIATGHFRVPPGLCIKTRSRAQPLIWKWFFILMQIKLICTRKVVHLASFWKWVFLELGSGLFVWSFTHNLLSTAEPTRDQGPNWYNFQGLPKGTQTSYHVKAQHLGRRPYEWRSGLEEEGWGEATLI